MFATSGLLQPINAGGRTSFKLGSTIPVKLRVTDCSGAPVDGLDLHVHLAMVGGGTPVASSAADTATYALLDGTGGQYLFDLSTKRSQFPAARTSRRGPTTCGSRAGDRRSTPRSTCDRPATCLPAGR